MSILTDPLPEHVLIHEKAYQINTDFRVSIRFEVMMNESDLSSTEKAVRALQLYYPAVPEDLGMAVEKIIWFYRCGKEEKQQSGKGKTRLESDYSFAYDDEYIYAAFMAQYGIDLTQTDMHWWRFRALFRSFMDCRFEKIREYRSIKITSKMSKEQRDFYSKMKELYKLPLRKEDQDYHDKMIDALMNGGDVNALLRGR